MQRISGRVAGPRALQRSKDGEVYDGDCVAALNCNAMPVPPGECREFRLVPVGEPQAESQPVTVSPLALFMADKTDNSCSGVPAVGATAQG